MFTCWVRHLDILIDVDGIPLQFGSLLQLPSNIHIFYGLVPTSWQPIELSQTSWGGGADSLAKLMVVTDDDIAASFFALVVTAYLGGCYITDDGNDGNSILDNYYKTNGI